MSTQQTALTKYIEANGNKLAYHWIGPATGTPLLMLIHYRGNIYFWDPSLIDPLTAKRPVIIFDNSGVGKSSGAVPNTFAGWGEKATALLAALKIPQVDLLGFFMGGAVAQIVALNAPRVFRRLILAGTKPSIGPDTVATEWPLVERFTYAMEPEAVEAAFAESFFTPSANGVAQAKAYWGRIHERAHDAVIMDAATTQAQLNDPWTHWETPNPQNSYERLMS